ncbi:hypothetical protein EV384_4432 [Micromonospora kangleipakensis]|uniref:Uncharacterized protein n=1 Tax=Micromonospora kangleipakensis TaxID=1077942 RepID=A0A4Q8BES1_9ACTN|nr:hypothetical protein EV384_4432 [Micromonospora kangleipakensis]
MLAAALEAEVDANLAELADERVTSGVGVWWCVTVTRSLGR